MVQLDASSAKTQNEAPAGLSSGAHAESVSDAVHFLIIYCIIATQFRLSECFCLFRERVKGRGRPMGRGKGRAAGKGNDTQFESSPRTLSERIVHAKFTLLT